ncbi:Hypothetical protein NTJ_05820 [Nesidiocoris tenuis]|uniref:Uncharacterized protein n=1 Tax=Nesidiocoris tenuis TaxID=355587 RepID=A0ABN7AM40_9HEMI|nr:Hypothetical protein NTJ_05820 [Nesidiocoris tenuis]
MIQNCGTCVMALSPLPIVTQVTGGATTQQERGKSRIAGERKWSAMLRSPSAAFTFGFVEPDNGTNGSDGGHNAAELRRLHFPSRIRVKVFWPVKAKGRPFSEVPDNESVPPSGLIIILGK